MKRSLIAAAAAVCLASGVAQAATVTVGIDNSNNCVSFGCGFSNGFATVQQIYASSQFSAPMTIGSISFYRDDAASFGTQTMDTQTFNIAFYYTSKTVNTTQNGGPDGANLPGNLGTLLSNFGTFTTSGTAPAVLTFAGNAFTYNPLLGNLIMQITTTSGVALWDGAQFQADDRGTVTRRVTPTGRFGNGAIALVTSFSTPSVAAAVPEPATWALMLGGFGLVGGAMRRRQKVTVRFA